MPWPYSRQPLLQSHILKLLVDHTHGSHDLDWMDMVRCIKGFLQKESINSVKSSNIRKKRGDTLHLLFSHRSESHMMDTTPPLNTKTQGSPLLLKAAFSQRMMALVKSSACKRTEGWTEHDHALTDPHPSLFSKKPQT